MSLASGPPVPAPGTVPPTSSGALPTGLGVVRAINPYVALVVAVLLIAGDVATHVFTGAQSYATLATGVALPGTTAMLALAAGSPAVNYLIGTLSHNKTVLDKVADQTNGSLTERLEAQTAQITETVLARLSLQDQAAATVASNLAAATSSTVTPVVDVGVSGA